MDIAWVIRPDILITHPPHSIHDDHARCLVNTMRANFLADLPAFGPDLPTHWVLRLYFAENWRAWKNLLRTNF